MTSIDKRTNQIYTTRGDDLDLDFQISTDKGAYTFAIGDVLRIGIYNARAFDKDALLIKDFKIVEESDTYHIHISSEDMKIGKLINRPKDYWYEIILNNDLTVIGYSKDNPAILTLLPEGSDMVAVIEPGGEENE